MSPKNERAMNNAAASLAMEGFVVLPEYRELCAKLLEKEINMQEYIDEMKKIICLSK